MKTSAIQLACEGLPKVQPIVQYLKKEWKI